MFTRQKKSLAKFAAESAGTVEAVEAFHREPVCELVFSVCDQEISQCIDLLYDAGHNIHNLKKYAPIEFRNYIYEEFLMRLESPAADVQRELAREVFMDYLETRLKFDMDIAREIIKMPG
ncbi:hypothetical protein Psal006b_01577 [Piscirickettsia salmonis]|uniref:Polyketide synthase, type I n=1 Tax=Piscirickettsia salmonis TaxID=1238 RepID=A0A1L6TBV2_PISSA|nr:hypothetical protein [Piscirickettsia salmonis]ALB22813.1 polyketide synthase, type I [Piscirickettsia salmonis]ALT18411.1 hypothetical protein PSLF89_05890 [Piscirickettsia salmonis LF-89 = ATCC VR-1361]ALY02799.1 hypothetical protein AWE47_07985 [Piscirickettsia salmonis]AMA42353.1 hypothetical protein AWJ11_08200 [Piscirickettsia salmonis]AOS34822.1 hypothetical protein AVM72_05335 [Piscirickettsia salmonis]